MFSFRKFSSFLDKIKANILSKIRKALNLLSFGSKVSIPINSNIIMNETIDIKSRLGYYSEYVTAYELSKLIENHGLSLKNTSTSNLKRLMEERRKSIFSFGVKDVEQEIDRMNSAGIALANAIYNDIITNGEDITTLLFEIELTGDSEKGKSKADLILTVYKIDEEQIVDRIAASLKAYKQPRINLANTTFVSLFKQLFYETTSSMKSEDFIEIFVKDFGSRKEITRLNELQNIIKKLTSEDGLDKSEARKMAKKTHTEVIEIMTIIFENTYKKNKLLVNKKMISLLGFDSDEDFYAAIGKSNKQRVISSRQSSEMKKLIEKLKGEFDIKIQSNPGTKNAFVTLLSPNDETIVRINVTFADTGGTGAQGKTNWFVDFKDFL